MKRLKKLTSLLLAFVLTMAMGLTAFAAGDKVTVSVPSDKLEGHKFTAYQIFSGTQSVDAGGNVDNDSALANVEWGSGINEEKFLSELQSSDAFGDPNPFKDCTTAAAVAAAMDGFTEAQGEIVAKIAYKWIEGDGTPLSTATTELDRGYYLIVDTTTNVGDDDAYNAALLQVTDNITIGVKTDIPTATKKVQEPGIGYNDIADYNIGDDVPFVFYSKVPNMSYYDTYRFIFHDTLGTGLTFNNDVKVYIDDAPLTSGYTVTQTGQEFTVDFGDLKTVVDPVNDLGKEIRIEYTAKLNTSAAIGETGNMNEMYLEYSNNPNESTTGQTTPDEVIVFTYELDTTKVDGEDTSRTLPNAEFKLYRVNEGVNEYVTLTADGKVSGWVNTLEDGTTLTSDENGLFKVTGLDAGTYYLQETKAPDGYNVLTNPLEIVITATVTTDRNNWDSSKTENLIELQVTNGGERGNASGETGIASITVANNRGAVLPSTGGIGTTIFYVLGSILVLGAVITLITKKRMSAE